MSEREVMRKHIIGSCFMSLFILGYIATVGLFAYQLIQGIFHIISAFAVGILTFIVIPIIKDIFTPHKNVKTVKKNGKLTSKKFVSGRIVLGEKRYYHTSNIVTSIVMAVIIAALGFIAFSIVQKKESLYTTVVTAEVLDYKVTTTTVTQNKGHRVETKESSTIELSLAYEFEGQVIKTTYNLGTTAKKFNAKTVGICLNDVGEIVSTYDSVKTLKIAIWICVAMVAYYLILAIFGFPMECSILGVFFAVGIALFFLLNSISLANWMYNAMSVFCLMFASCGSVGFVAFLNVIFLPPSKAEEQEKEEYQSISPRLRQEGVDIDDFNN